MAEHLKVVDFPHTPLHDVPTKLRELADDIENGVYGSVSSCGVAVFGNTLEIFGFGSEASGPTVNLLFQAAVARFATEIERHGR